MSYIIPGSSSIVWKDRGQGPQSWGNQLPNTITSSSIGDKLVAVTFFNNILRSANYGASWLPDTTPGVSERWTSVASDSTATNLIATSRITGGNIWLSTDSGNIWTEQVFAGSPPAGQNWRSAASNDDGSILAATIASGNIYVSVDGGVNWISRASALNWWGITCQTVGGGAGTTKFAATVNVGNIWVSSDSGTSWTDVTTLAGPSPPSTLNWGGIAADATATKLATVVNGGNIWLSTNSGVGWVEVKAGEPGIATPPLPSLAWKDIASSSDGASLVAVVKGGNIWTSTDSGANWTEDTTVGGTENWTAVTSSVAGDYLAAVVNNGNIWTWPSISETLAVTMPNPACDVQIGGPQPPRLWSRAPEDCIPTTNSNAPLLQVATQQDLDMRRKAEILQYKKNDSNMSRKQLWARTIKGHGPSGNRTWATQSADGTYTNPNIDNLAQSTYTLLCPGRPKNCAPTTSSDVPGKQMMLCMRPDIPLTNYIVNRTYLAGGTKWPQTAWKPGDNGFPVGKSGRTLIFN